MIDATAIQLQPYSRLPHLALPVVTDPKNAVLALRWVVSEMEKRYEIFSRVGALDIHYYNERHWGGPLPIPEQELPLTAGFEEGELGTDVIAVPVDDEIAMRREDRIVLPGKLSYIVVIIDEMADLMLVAPEDVEMAIVRLTQLGHAAGIHCIFATRQSSQAVITDRFGMNLPARIAFRCSSRIESRAILGQAGAERLSGNGDMLYLASGPAKLIRAQGPLVTDPEIQCVVDFIARQGRPTYDVEIHRQLSKSSDILEEEEGLDEDESLIEQCIEVIRSEQLASVSLLQRRQRLGCTRAARTMDELENRGIVGPSKGAEPRDILVDLDGREGRSASAGEEGLP